MTAHGRSTHVQLLLAYSEASCVLATGRATHTPRVFAHPKLCGAMTKSLHSMSPGFRLAAVRQASTGSSESCQDCFQYIRQSLMENQGYCEDTREDHVPSQAKRQKVCSQASQGKSTACHRGMRQEDLDLGNALHPSEHAPEYSQPRQENHPACHLDAMSCKSSAGKSCELQASNSRVQSSLLAQVRVAEADAMQKAEIAARLIAQAQHMARKAKLQSVSKVMSQACAKPGRTRSKNKSSQRRSYDCEKAATSVARTHSKTRAGAAAAAASNNCCRLAHNSSTVFPPSTHTQQQPKQQQQEDKEYENYAAPAVLHSCSPQARCGLSAALHLSQVGGSMPPQPLSSALPMSMPFSCVSSASTAQAPCLNRQESASMAKAVQQKREQHTPAQQVSGQLILDRPSPTTDQSNAFPMAKPGSSLRQGPDPKHEYACSAVPQGRLLSLTGLHCDMDESVHPGLCCFTPCPPESNDSQTRQFDAHLALPDSMALTASDTPARSLPDPPEAPTDLEPGGSSDVDRQQQQQQQQLVLNFSACLHPPHRPLTIPQLYCCGPGGSATVLRHQHQLHMIDLMLARVAAAEEAMQQGITVNAQYVPCLSSGFGTIVTAQHPLAGVQCVPGDDCFPARVAPITHSEPPFVSAGLSNHDMLSSLASTDIAHSLCDHLNATAQAHTVSAEGDLGSVVDGPGSSLVPNDWLTDDCEFPDLPCLVSLVHLGKPVSTSLPLMPPSLGDVTTTHAARRLL